jgi:transposase
MLNPWKEIARLNRIIAEQAKIIAELTARLDRYENPKNSRNSSIPPSHDYSRPPRTKSLREPSEKKPGGQPGHEGVTLQMVDKPDETIKHIPQYCTCCGLDLSQVPYEKVESRQQIELPPIEPRYVEHQSFGKKCTCGNIIVGSFPQGVTPGISYGSSVISLIAYLNIRHFIPFDRLKEVCNTVFRLPISAGTLVDCLNRAADKAKPAYELIREKVNNSRTNGGDETGMKINGQKGWFWTLQGKMFTFIIASLNRGAQTLHEHFPNGFAFSVLVHDCWKCYFKVTALAHQICTAHLLREFNHVKECYDLKWATDFKQLLVETIAFKKTLQPGDYHKTLIQRTEFEERLNNLLQEPINPKYPIALSLQKRLVKYRQHIFTFLYYHQVPPDNNGSERAIRNVKVKQKISGQFKSFQGAANFAILRSVIDTAIKNNLNPLHSLSQIYTLPL